MIDINQIPDNASFKVVGDRGVLQPWMEDPDPFKLIRLYGIGGHYFGIDRKKYEEHLIDCAETSFPLIGNTDKEVVVRGEDVQIEWVNHGGFDKPDDYDWGLIILPIKTKTDKMKTGIELIAEERKEQIEKHNRTIAIDVEYNDDEQLRVAALELLKKAPKFEHRPFGWNKDVWARMISKSNIKRLIIAGALIAAEIDRLQTQEVNNGN